MRDRARESLRLVAMMVRQQDVGDVGDAELVQPVEDETAAEVDGDRVAPRDEDVYVARVVDDVDAVGDPCGGQMATLP